MLKRLLLVLALTLAGFPAAAQGDALRDRIVRELRDEGFTEIRMSRTLLGRVRFLGIGPPGRREIVLNPATGVILRDYFQAGAALPSQSGQGGSSSSGATGATGAAGGGSDDDDDDDWNEDDDDDWGGNDNDRDDDDDDDDRGDRSGGSGGSGGGGGGDRDDDDDDDD
ncbi:MAG: hypothetical protein QNJ13_15930 [Paracoccaceae bacterium]|nr:hypothetical protein [Paracoccaceae bacterium]